MFKRHGTVAAEDAGETARACLTAGIEAAHPEAVIQREVTLSDHTLGIAGSQFDLQAYDRLLVVGGGKATATVAGELDAMLGDRIDAGVVVAPEAVAIDHIDVVVGDHPVPSERGVAGARQVLELVETADEHTLVLAVITGGGSALLPAPVPAISLDDLQQVTDALLESGATIHEINAVRKHLSAIKGGGLARTAAPATVVGLLFSDVVGNDLDVIASGPTAPDASTYSDAIEILDRYDIDPPKAVAKHLEGGRRGEEPETPRDGDPVFDRVQNFVLADGFTAVAAASETAIERGYTPCIVSSRVRGEAREAAKTHIAIAEEVRATGHPVDPPAVVLSGGETTVTVRGSGEGGPNQEYVVSGALELELAETVLAAVDTDGRDGATDAAGGIIDAETVTDPSRAREALAANDAYPYLVDRDAILKTGATGTNVNDLRVAVIEDIG